MLGIELHWWWLGLGVALIAAEALVPGAVLVWFGIAAIVTGLVDWLIAPSWEWQLLVFSVVGVGATAAFWRWKLARGGTGSEPPLVNRGGAELIGRTVTLATDIVDGHGRARLGDTSWRVDGPDLPAGTRVRIVGVDAGTLIVEPEEPERGS